MNRQGAVNIHDPLIDVARHVEQAIIVGGILVNVDSDVSKVIQCTCHTHVVASSLDEVGVDLAVAAVPVVAVPHKVTVPRVRLALCDEFTQAVSNQTERSKFPLSFGRQTVAWQQHAVFDPHIPEFGGGRKIGKAFADALTLILSREVGVGGEMLFIDLGLWIVGQQPFTNQDSFVHTIRSPLAEVIRLQPAHADDWVIPVSRVAQVVIHHGLVVGELVSP